MDMKIRRHFTSLLPLLLIPVIVSGQELKPQSAGWPVVEKQMKPWSRWWWMGSAVNEKNLEEVLQQYKAAGLGGLEITPVFGAKGYEQQYIPYLSPRWMDMLQFTVKQAAAGGMGVDMNTGTGWPFGGPQVAAATAAAKLITQRYVLKAGERLKERITAGEGQDDAILQALTAYGSRGEVMELLSDLAPDGKLHWSPSNGTWELYAVFSGRTRQQVKRAAPGGEGFTLDHLDQHAVTHYLNRFDTAFHHQPQGIRSFFNDSYEVYGATWTPSFLSAFKKNRGYDLALHIRELVQKDEVVNTASAAKQDSLARLKSDYRQTMDELLLDNFTRNWSGWAHRNQSATRNQSHGSPGNLLDLYGAVDIPETETFGSSYFPIPGLRRDPADVQNVDPDPIMAKFAASAAHTGGKTLVSSETFTWLTEHFKTAYSQCKPEAEKLFLSGVNHIFYHGTTNSPSGVAWPGWLFYASAEFNPNNSLWPHITGMNDYITRCQSVLQSGRADNELLIYWPVFEVWHEAKRLDMPLKVHDIDKWLTPSACYQLADELSTSGYAYDFASDRVLMHTKVNGQLLETSATANPYRQLLIPASRILPIETLENILRLAKNGATVIFQQQPEDVPGLFQLKERREKLKSLWKALDFREVSAGVQSCKVGAGQVILAGEIQKALTFTHSQGEKLSSTGLQFIRRKIDGGVYYYLVNHTAADIDKYIPLQAKGHVFILDPQSGATGKAETQYRDSTLQVRVQMKSGEALILKIVTADLPDQGTWTYLNKAAASIYADQPWSLHFTEGGPVLPEDRKMDKPAPWTTMGDAKMDVFSGAATYTSSFMLPAKNAKEYLLHLGQVNESARIWINGKDAGVLWSIPYQMRIGQFLKKGRNTIKIEVRNLMANRIRDMDRKKIVWKNYHEINFVNINYKPFDASAWEVMPSGLSGPVTITPYR